MHLNTHRYIGSNVKFDRGAPSTEATRKGIIHSTNKIQFSPKLILDLVLLRKKDTAALGDVNVGHFCLTQRCGLKGGSPLLNLNNPDPDQQSWGLFTLCIIDKSKTIAAVLGLGFCKY